MKNKVWIGCIALFIAHQIAQKIGHWRLLFLDNYLDPFLSMPILLGSILVERNYLLQKLTPSTEHRIYQFSIFETVVLSIFFSLIFEEGFSYLSKRFTLDYWDYIAYFGGSLLFYFTINTYKEPSTNTQKNHMGCGPIR